MNKKVKRVIRSAAGDFTRPLAGKVTAAILLAVLHIPGAAGGIEVDGNFAPGEWNPVLEKRAANQDQPWGPNNDLINLYLSWDGDSIYAGVEGYSSANNVFFIYIDSSARDTGAEQNDYYPGFNTQSEGWDPDYLYAVCEMEEGIGASVREIFTDGSTAVLSGAHHASLPGSQNANGTGGWEISLPWDQVQTEAGGSLKIAAGLGWSTDKYDPEQPLGGGSGDELGADQDNQRLTLDNPVQVQYDTDLDGEPDEVSAGTESVRVRFRLLSPGASTVNLAGDFNQWCNPSGSCIDTGIDPMTDPDGDGVWLLEKQLSQDYHEYRFVVDGCQWLSDPLNPDVNPENNNNSVLIVTDPLVYYLQPLDGTSIQESCPSVTAALAHSDSSALDLDQLRIYVDDILTAEGLSYFHSDSSMVVYTGIDSLDEGIHEVRVAVRNMSGAYGSDSSLFQVDTDSVAPVIIHSPPSSVTANSTVTMSAVITDDEEVETAVLYYRRSGESQFIQSDFTGGFEDEYYTEIPGSLVTEGSIVEYYIVAGDGINQTMEPAGGIFSFPVTGDDLDPVISDHFASPGVISPDGNGKDDAARISFRVSEPAEIDLSIITSAGEPVDMIMSDPSVDEGYHSAIWDGSDSLGAAVPDGMYQYVITARDLAGNVSIPAEGQLRVDNSAPEGTLKLVLLFHANQTVNYQGDTANDVCFNGLLSVLRRHPESRFMLHFSGSLLHDLQWYDFRNSPSTIEMLTDGVSDGQFEIVGSTYAQNIPYSTHMWDNNVQIDVQRTVIERSLGVSPVSFWNAERCWKQELVPMIAENGYGATWVESHILFDSGTDADEHAVRRTGLGENEVIVFNDDAELIGNINYAIDSGNSSGLVDYLANLHSQDIYRDYVVCYCEDAEATGLWDYEGGQDPRDNWNNLDNMLDVLESIEWVELTTFSEYLSSGCPTEMLAPIADGQANWMVGPSQSAGYRDWFDYNENSPLLDFYRDFFDRKRERVRGLSESVAPNTPAGRLAEHALRNFAAHQFEFGCIGCGDFYCQDYHKMETVEASCLAAEYARNRVSENRILQKDCNGDSIPDILLVTPSDMFIFSRTGGRLLYWFDLQRGEQIAGNEIFMKGYYYRGWREYYQGSGYNDDYHYSEDFVWDADPEYPPAQPYHRVYGIRKKCFNEMISSGSGIIDAFLNDEYGFALDGDTLRFSQSGSGITLEKSFYPESGGLAVRYRTVNNRAYSINISHMVENSFCPSLIEVMDYGRESLKYLAGEDTSSTVTSSTDGIVNLRTGMRVNYRFGTQPDNLSGERNVFALELNPGYQRGIGPGESEQYGFVLNAEVVTDSGGQQPPAPPRLELHQNYPNPFNPTTRIKFSVREQGRVTIRIYNVRGQMVRQLLNQVREPGTHSVLWAGLDEANRPVASGVYLCRLESSGSSDTKKLVLLR